MALISEDIDDITQSLQWKLRGSHFFSQAFLLSATTPTPTVPQSGQSSWTIDLDLAMVIV